MAGVGADGTAVARAPESIPSTIPEIISPHVRVAAMHLDGRESPRFDPGAWAFNNGGRSEGQFSVGN